MALLLLYLGYSAEKLDRFVPGEESLAGNLGKLLLPYTGRYDGTLKSVNRQDILILQVTLFFLPASLCWLLALREVFRCSLPRSQVMAIVFGGAALLRLLLVPSMPALETDHHRYLWDGMVTAEGMNPFEFAPVEISNHVNGKNRHLYSRAELARLDKLSAWSVTPAMADHFKRINHPRVPTVYPPTAQALFAAAHSIKAGSATALKGLIALVDLAVVLVLASLLLRLGRDPRWSLAYGWCPLILKEHAGTGHYDSLAVLFTLVALHSLFGGRRLMPALSLAVAGLSKIYPLMLVPLLFRRLRITGVLLVLATFVAGYLPFISIGFGVTDGLAEFSKSWEFNSSAFAFMQDQVERRISFDDPIRVALAVSRSSNPEGAAYSEQLLDSFFCTKVIAGLLLLTLLVYLCWTPARDDLDLAGRCSVAITALLLLSPVSNPWYFSWVAPFFCIFPAASAAWLAWSMSLYYLYFLKWDYLPWARPLEYLPFYLLLALERIRAAFLSRQSKTLRSEV